MSRGLRWDSLPATAKSKYGNQKVMVDGYEFDSKREAQCYHELKLRQHAGEIRNLRLQVPHAIVVNGIHICDYIADFVYDQHTIDSRGEEIIPWREIVADAKGAKTAVYRLKKKMMLAVRGIVIVEL
jgi:hypothetical protein